MATMRKIRGKVIPICKTIQGNMIIYRNGEKGKFYCRPTKAKKIWQTHHYTDGFNDLQGALVVADWNEKFMWKRIKAGG